jgi:phosphatidate cytidylyltransferase
MGKGLGKRKLYETVSPKKTIVGAYGSVIGAIFISLLFNVILSLGLSILQAVALGLVIGVVSIVGDLVESMFKRDSGIKDSGSVIPGHGGILDKIDGLVFVSPVVYWIVSRMIIL